MKKIKIIAICILLIGLMIGIACCNIQTKTDGIQATVKELVQLKDKKQSCLDSLSYQEAIEEYKGISHCGIDDEEIIRLKKELEEFLKNDYEKVDEKIQEKILADTETTNLEKLSFLLSE